MELSESKDSTQNIEASTSDGASSEMVSTGSGSTSQQVVERTSAIPTRVRRRASLMTPIPYPPPPLPLHYSEQSFRHSPQLRGHYTPTQASPLLQQIYHPQQTFENTANVLFSTIRAPQPLRPATDRLVFTSPNQATVDRLETVLEECIGNTPLSRTAQDALTLIVHTILSMLHVKGLLNRCSRCGHYGHSSDNCRQRT